MEIPMPKAAATNNTIDAKINFDANMNPKVNIIQKVTGYRATEKIVRYLSNATRKEELMKEILTSGMKSQNLRNTQVETNLPTTQSQIYLLRYRASLMLPTWLKKPETTFCLKLAIELLQTELYQEHERQNPIDMQYPVDYKRIITIEIPQAISEGLTRPYIYLPRRKRPEN